MNKYYEIGADGKLQFTANGNGLINKYKIMQATKADSEILSIANALKAEGLSKSNTVAIILDMQLTDGYGKYYTEERVINIISGKEAEVPVDEPAVTIKNTVPDDEPVIIAKPETTKEFTLPKDIDYNKHNHRINKNVPKILKFMCKNPNLSIREIMDYINNNLKLRLRNGGKYTYTNITNIRHNVVTGVYGPEWKNIMEKYIPGARPQYNEGFYNYIVELRDEMNYTFGEIATTLNDLGKLNLSGNPFSNENIRLIYTAAKNRINKSKSKVK